MTMHHTVIEKEMSIPEAEFHRIMARFLEGRNHQVTDDGFIVEEGGHALEARIIRLPDRKITALMVLPRIRVHFSFTGHSNDEVRDLMVVIDRHFQRGGG